MWNKTLENAFFLTLVFLVTVAFMALIQGFMQALFWAATLAILFHPIYRYGLTLLGQRASLTAILTLLLIIVIVILPLSLVGVAVTHEAADVYARISSGDINLQKPLQFLRETLPTVTSYLDRFGIDAQRLQQNLSSAAVSVSQWLASQAFNIGQNALQFGIMFCLMLYLLFFFLRDGTSLIHAMMRALPLGDEREQRLFSRFAEVSRATIKGTLVVALIQGGIGGLAFWILDIQAAVFWGTIMALLSLLPAVGSAIIWGPAALIFIASGAYVKGLILLGIGILVIGLVDNFLRPILVGRDTRMPDYLVLIATLGGLTVFGVSGFVIGPIIAALFLTVWEMFEQEHRGGAAHGTASPDEVKIIVPKG
ncbi:MAG TPA: AI-2E family transporter [Candidatus Entotheonella sp.]|jgi:predicted PurR-regulated permease PerM